MQDSDGLIGNALLSVLGRLNDNLKNRHPRPDDWVTLSNVVDHQGQELDDARNKLVMMLLNMQQETTVSTYRSATPTSGSTQLTSSPPLYINMEVLFYANMSGGKDSYLQALNAISETVSFFRSNPVFTRDVLPSLDPRIDKLAFEYSSLDLAELNHAFDLVGVKSMPAAIYKVRMLPFNDQAMSGNIDAVTNISVDR